MRKKDNHTERVRESPGLVVMGRDSRSEGPGFKSSHRILDGHFFTYNCCKNCNDCLKRPKKRKRGRDWPIFKKRVKEREGKNKR